MTQLWLFDIPQVYSMERMFKEICLYHYPNPSASPIEIEEFERRMGWCLDPDMRAFYRYCNGAQLFRQGNDIAYAILPLSEIFSPQRGPPSMYAVCDVQDGDHIIADVSRQENGRYPLIDGFHECYPDPAYCKQIAGSFAEFLLKALRSEGLAFWLGEE